jgi:hypothetical protein
MNQTIKAQTNTDYWLKQLTFKYGIQSHTSIQL